MRYGSTYATATEFDILKGSFHPQKKNAQIIRHYPGTDISEHADLGREATVITCTIVTKSDSERILIEQLLHGTDELNLYYHNFYYKQVVPGAQFDPVPQTVDKSVWYIEAEFIALDPIPYDKDTDGALY